MLFCVRVQLTWGIYLRNLENGLGTLVHVCFFREAFQVGFKGNQHERSNKYIKASKRMAKCCGAKNKKHDQRDVLAAKHAQQEQARSTNSKQTTRPGLHFVSFETSLSLSKCQRISSIQAPPFLTPPLQTQSVILAENSQQAKDDQMVNP